MTLLIDVHEPDDAFVYFEGVIPYERQPLNTRGWADYRWNTHDGQFVHVERKQWGEVLTGLDSIENQLRLHMDRQPDARLIFLIEGMATGNAHGTRIFKQTNNEKIWVASRESAVRKSQVFAWLYQIAKYVELYQTFDYYDTCVALCSFYKGDQKKEHSTFKRHFKSVEYHYDPRITQLMGLLPGIGQARAEALIDKFITPWGVLNAKPEQLMQVPGIGTKLAYDILRKVGRTDV